MLEGANWVFGEAPKAEQEPTIDLKSLHAKIGELTLENDYCPARDTLRGKRHRFERTEQGSVAERKKMINPTAKLNVNCRAIELGISGAACVTIPARRRTPI